MAPNRLIAAALVAAAIIPGGWVGSSPAAAQLDDACATLPPTMLDGLPGWECVGPAGQVGAPARPGAAADQAPAPTQAGTLELAVAVSPDGRLYRQLAPAPPGPAETPSVPNDSVSSESRESGETAEPGASGSGPAGQPRPPGPLGGLPESVLPPDDRLLDRATTAFPGRAMTAILAPGQTTSNCSGTLVGPRHVLTAGHCIHRGGGGGEQGWYEGLTVAPGMDGIGRFPNGLKTSVWYFSVNGWVDNADPAYDYGMIVVEDRADTAGLGWLGWRLPQPEGQIWVYGYPGYFLGCAASPLPDRECGNYLYGDGNGYENLPSEPLLYHLADTDAGESGAAMFEDHPDAGGRQAIGVHTRGGTINAGTRLTPARLNNVCDWIRANPSAFSGHACQ